MVQYINSLMVNGRNGYWILDIEDGKWEMDRKDVDCRACELAKTDGCRCGLPHSFRYATTIRKDVGVTLMVWKVGCIKDINCRVSRCGYSLLAKTRVVFYLIMEYLDQRLSPCLITSPLSMRLFKSL
jgi:hypothetical protein